MNILEILIEPELDAVPQRGARPYFPTQPRRQ